MRVQPVDISARIGIEYDLPAFLVVGVVHHPPLNLLGWKWHFKLCEDLSDIQRLGERGIVGVRHGRKTLRQSPDFYCVRDS